MTDILDTEKEAARAARKARWDAIHRERDRLRLDLHREYSLTDYEQLVTQIRMENASSVLYAAYRKAKELLESIEADQEVFDEEDPPYRLDANSDTLLKLIEMLMDRYNHQDATKYPTIDR